MQNKMNEIKARMEARVKAEPGKPMRGKSAAEGV